MPTSKKKGSLKPLSKKAVSPKKAAAVKGGSPIRIDRLAANHNQVTLSRLRS